MSSAFILKSQPLSFPWPTSDPFLFCVFHEDFYPRGNSCLGPDDSLAGRNLGQDFSVKNGYRMYHGTVVPGFPAHPHRGFETVTVVNKGIIDHADSTGAAGRYGEGDTQWMTAGRGIQHSEMFPLLKKGSENHLELFQIWLNLPSQNKFVEPYFTMLWSEDTPQWNEIDAKGKETNLKLVSGRIGENVPPSPPPNSWASDLENEVLILTVKMEEGASWTLPAASPSVNRVIYFFKGQKVKINTEIINQHNAYTVIPDTELALESIQGEIRILVLQGKPIGETVVQRGPFVMNSKAEIEQAYADFMQTKFGGWPWPEYDVTHGENRNRFAQHSDGRLEEPNINSCPNTENTQNEVIN